MPVAATIEHIGEVIRKLYEAGLSGPQVVAHLRRELVVGAPRHSKTIYDMLRAQGVKIRSTSEAGRLSHHHRRFLRDSGQTVNLPQPAAVNGVHAVLARLRMERDDATVAIHALEVYLHEPMSL